MKLLTKDKAKPQHMCSQGQKDSRGNKLKQHTKLIFPRITLVIYPLLVKLNVYHSFPILFFA